MSTHLPANELGYATAGVLLLLGVYVGGYFSMVSRSEDFELAEIPESVMFTESIKSADGSEVRMIHHRNVTKQIAVPCVIDAYPFPDVIGVEHARMFFSPIHDLDRRIRVEMWDQPKRAPVPELEPED
jgi:hypothetical protein